MWDALLWLYIINATLLIVHEIDSAYWREWELFGLRGGLEGFLALHLPLVFVILWGLLQTARHTVPGAVLSLVLAAGGLFAFGIHTFFLRRGHPQFRLWLSRAILTGTLIVSILQGAVGIRALVSVLSTP